MMQNGYFIQGRWRHVLPKNCVISGVPLLENFLLKQEFNGLNTERKGRKGVQALGTMLEFSASLLLVRATRVGIFSLSPLA